MLYNCTAWKVLFGYVIQLYRQKGALRLCYITVLPERCSSVMLYNCTAWKVLFSYVIKLYHLKGAFQLWLREIHFTYFLTSGGQCCQMQWLGRVAIWDVILFQVCRLKVVTASLIVLTDTQTKPTDASSVKDFVGKVRIVFRNLYTKFVPWSTTPSHILSLSLDLPRRHTY